MKSTEQHVHDILKLEPNYAELPIRIAKLSTDERRILTLLLERIEQGKQRYGAWDLKSDSRNNPHEALEEVLDALHYVAASLLVLRDRI